MKRFILMLSLVCLGAVLSISDAEAKRMGGGRSLGMQRDMSTVRPATPPSQAAPMQQARPTPGTPANPAAAAPKRNWMGPLAGLAAGLGLGALLSSMGLSGAMEGFLNILLIALGAVLLFKLLSKLKRPTPAQETPLHYAGVGGPNVGPIPEQMPVASQSQSAPQTVTEIAPVPADFDQENFLRVAKVNFIRLQAAFDSANLDDLREFTTPELFAEIKLDLQARGAQTQTTDVVTLEATLLDVRTEDARHIATVRFEGLIREESDAAAQPVAELWHLIKPVDGSRGWTVAGIQQTA